MARTTTRRRTSRRNPARSTGMLVVNPRRRRNTRKKYYKSAATRKRSMRGMFGTPKRRNTRRRSTKKGMVRRTARKAYRPKRRNTSRRRNGTRAGQRRKTARRAYKRRNTRSRTTRRRNTRAGQRRTTARRAYRKKNRLTTRRRRRNPSMKQSIAKLPLIGKPLSMMWGFAPAAALGAISVEPTMMVARLLGDLVGDKIPASLFYSIIGLGLATVVQYLPIKDKTFRDKLSVAVASAAGGVAFYKWRTGMDTSVAQEVGLLQLHGAGSGFGALELFPGPLNGAMGALELYPGPLNGYGDGMAYSVNPYPGAISNGSY